MKRMISLLLSAGICLGSTAYITGCDRKDNQGGADFYPAVTEKRMSKDEYVNKTLGGLLGQFAGFLSGYEFVWQDGKPRIGLPESWYEFLNGPYAGNYKYFRPFDTGRYDRLRVDPITKQNKVWSDDDYHLDIFNQYVMKEAGTSAYAIKETWKKYTVSDWGGGGDAMGLIQSKDMLPPFTGTIEGGNRFSWCTEAYIENETLGMNAPGMPNVATELADVFASNVGYYDSVIWAKYYAAMYSIAYFETDIVTVMEKAKDVLPKGSLPYRFYGWAWEAYEKYPNDYANGAKELEAHLTNLYRRDNVQTDPNVNGGFALLSCLYGKNSYLESCKYASILGYDGDCTAAIVAGVMGILKGFKEGNEEYDAINSTLYYNGEGIYHNDEGNSINNEGPYQARIISEQYPTDQKIDDIVKLYQENFEKLLVENGGRIVGDEYVIPTTDVMKDHSYLFDNYDAERQDTTGFDSQNGTLSCIVETDAQNTHGGVASFRFKNEENGVVSHTYTNLTAGRVYRLSVYAKASNRTQVTLFARETNGKNETFITFADTSLINKELIFTATANTMQVGFSFDDEQRNGNQVIFDDFMLEEINRKTLSTVSKKKLSPASEPHRITVEKPEEVAIGEQVILCVQVRNSNATASVVPVERNGKAYGSVVVSKTSKNAESGQGYVDIPYVFENSTDEIRLVFDNDKFSVGKVELCTYAPYMFR